MNTNYEIKTAKEAVEAVVTYNTLPSQIDYRLPWRLKADIAQEFINDLPDDERAKCNMEICDRLEAYNTEDESGYSPADMAEMF